MESENSNEVEEQKRGFLKRIGCGKLVLGFLGLLLLVAGCWYWSLSRDRSAFLRHAEEIAREVEAGQVEVPEDENAAPLYQEASSLYVEPYKSAAGKEDYWHLENSGRVMQAKPEVRAKFLKDNQPYLDALKRAIERPRCDFRLRPRTGEDMVPDKVVELRTAARFLAVAARIRAHEGKAGEAIDLLLICLRMGRDAGGGGMVPRMVQTVCEGITIAGIEGALEECEPDAASVEELLAALGKHHAERGNMQAWMRFEKAGALAYYGPMVSGEVSASDLTTAPTFMVDLGLASKPSRFEKARYWLWQKGGFVIKDARHYERVMDRYIEAAAKPYPRAWEEARDIAAGLEEPPAWWAGVSCTLLGAYSRIFRSDARLEAKLRAARLGVGCRLYKMKFGKYPEKLSDLSAKLPEHFKKLPVDPFTGKPMVYKKTAKGCMIYSLGDDLKDDGGTRYRSSYKPHDWVFELKR